MDRLEHEGFDRLLMWLDSDRERAGARYENLHRRLVLFFEARKCGAGAEDLADRTLDTIARKLREGTPISCKPESYCYGVANKLRLELTRLPVMTPLMGNRAYVPEPVEEDQDRLESCMEKCLEFLTVQERELITRFYDGKGRNRIEARKQMAAEAGISRNSLGLRAFKIRRYLEQCMQEYIREKPGTGPARPLTVNYTRGADCKRGNTREVQPLRVSAC